MPAAREHDPVSPGQRLLVEAGQAAYGPFWQAQAARELGKSGAFVGWMATGRKPVPAALWAPLAALLERRVSDLRGLEQAAQACPQAQEGHAFLRAAGEAMYGPVWAKAMAEDLVRLAPGVLPSGGKLHPYRRLARMARGEQPMPPGLVEEVHKLAAIRRAGLEKVHLKVCAKADMHRADRGG